ncbi:MAG: DUF5615 family PIN-like protein [Terricaulis sp.]
MRFIVDQQLPPALAAWLRSRGHQADHVRDIGLRDADDGEVWNHAERLNAVIVTKDHDFVARRSARTDGPAIVWLRVGNSTTPRLLTWIEPKWPGVDVALSEDVAIVEVR